MVKQLKQKKFIYDSYTRMDEVGGDNMEDINDLEARLYAQVHHESNDAGDAVSGSAASDKTRDNAPTVRKVTATSVVNKVMGKSAGRYWQKDSKAMEHAQKQYQDRGELKGASSTIMATPPPQKNIAKVAKNSSQTIKTTGVTKSSPLNTNQTPHAQSPIPQKEQIFQSPKPRAASVIANVQSPNEDLEDIKPQDIDIGNIVNKSLRFNPASKKRQQHQKAVGAAHVNPSKGAPFSKQIQKLQKVKRLEAKRQKSKAAQSKINKPTITMDTITLETTEESSDDDVISIPIPPPPTYTIDDSDEDQSDTAKKLSEKNTSNDAMTLDNEQQQLLLENNSRCTSPSSIISTDDFIGPSDRRRLRLESVMADDDDLILLTADFDSLLEVPSDRQQLQQNTELNKSTEKTLDKTRQTESKTTTATRTNQPTENQYRVELSDFRAVDVYESESEKEESGVSTRGGQSIIRCVNSSDDENVQSVVKLRERLKRLHKRNHGGNKERRQHDSESSDAQSDNDMELDDGIGQTPVPFIVQGPAVERRKVRHSNNSQSSTSKVQRKSAENSASVGRMSDKEFIATINTLAKGGTEDPEKDSEMEAEPNDNESDADDDDDFDHAAVPSARTIAEQVLAGKNKNKTKLRQAHTTDAVAIAEQSNASKTASVEQETPTTSKSQKCVNETTLREALPDESLTHLNNIFDVIDSLDTNKRRESDSDDYDDGAELEDNKKLKKLTIRKMKINKEVRDPVYNVVYSEKRFFVGGLGWNDEMRRFYNDSWNGEHFNVKAILMHMNPDRNLWKIYTEDRFPIARNAQYRKKCFNCCEFGHTRAKCLLPRKPLICYMCGELGHSEPRCPNTICLRCGNKTHVYTKSCNACSFQNRLICPVCKVRGHTVNLCPDKWRRYHSTILPNTYPNSDVEYKKKKCCCICAGRGHLSDTCRSAVRFLEYPLHISFIKSHQKSYNDQLFKTKIPGIALNLMYKPEVEVHFDFAENTTIKDYYGRFLQSVGMLFLLNRKRKAHELESTPTQKKRRSITLPGVEFIPTNLQPGTKQTSTSAPDQVQEISESGNVDNIAVEAVNVTDSVLTTQEDENMQRSEEDIPTGNVNVNVDEDVQMESTDAINATKEKTNGNTSFKKPTVVKENVQTQSSMAADQPEQVVLLDSDSNYSFSEHFDADPTTDKSHPSTETTISKARPREMEPLPDFIPISDGDNSNDNYDEDELSMQAGISKKYTSFESDEGEHDQNSNLQPDEPTNAKIYLTHFHSKYLLSPPGHKFLVEQSRECNIQVRLDWTSVGHVLNIFGLQSNQDRFHHALLLKYRELTDEMNKKRSENIPKVPRKSDVLIRFLRESINQLSTNLGNVNEHWRRVKHFHGQQEHQHTKSGVKMAEKSRRLLNMMLLGQAGLQDGSMHLDELLLNLKKLISCYKSDELVPNELRDEVDMHWKVIFTSYQHDNYEDLVQHYNRMLSKNLIPKLNIDPILLGDERTTDLNLSTEQQPSKHVKEKRCSIVPNPFNPKNSKRVCDSPPPPAPSMKTTSSQIPLSSPNASNSNFVPPTNSLKLKNFSAAPFIANRNQRAADSHFTVAGRIKAVSQKWENTCDALLNKINFGKTDKFGPDRDCKAASMFWSRESIKYIDECMKTVTKGNLREKLQRVLRKSQTGQLSYNDYRAIIKIRNAILGN